MKLLKRLVLGLSAAAIAALPLATQAAETIRLESEVTVANVTGGVAPNYQKSATAKVDDIVRVQVWYHNRENENSGKVANNLRVKINVPTAQGKTQTVTSTVSADSANTVTDTAAINLSVDRARLAYIPGSAKWRHNAGTNANVNYVTEPISDAVVTGANGLVLENAQPCFNFEATVSAEFRVKADVVSIQKLVRVSGQKEYVAENSAKAGDTLEYVLKVKNEGNTTLRKVVVGDNMPPFATYVPGSTRLVNANTGTAGKLMPDNITTGGITIDDMAPGGSQLVYLKLKLADSIPGGNHPLKNVGIVKPQNMQEVYNVAVTNVNVPVGGGSVPTPVTPVTPGAPAAPLPETGVGALAGVAGTGTLGYAVRSYLRSKRSLVDALTGAVER